MARIMMVALIRNKLIRKEGLRSYELAIISGTTTGNISHLLRYKRFTPRIDNSRRPVIPYEQALEFLEGANAGRV